MFAELEAECQNKGLGAPYLALLRLFGSGTYADYIRNATSLPALNDRQILKLKYLSIVSFCSSRRTIPYDFMMANLGLASERELEDMIIECICQDLVIGKLDQSLRQFEVEYAIGRDIQPGQVDQLVEFLSQWSAKASSITKAMSDSVQDGNGVFAANLAQLQKHHGDLDICSRQMVAKRDKEASAGFGAFADYESREYHEESKKSAKRGRKMKDR